VDFLYVSGCFPGVICCDTLQIEEQKLHRPIALAYIYIYISIPKKGEQKDDEFDHENEKTRRHGTSSSW